MLEIWANRTAFRGAVAVICLALIAGCGPGTAIPLAAAPAILTATAANCVVTLAWSISNGATSYNVKRGTADGGPYTQLANATSPG